MIEASKQKEPTQQQIIKLLDAKQPPPPIDPSSSTFHKDYLQFFNGIEDTIPLDKMIGLLSQQNIRYIPERDHTLFSIHATDLNNTYQLGTLLVELGPFDLNLSLLNNISKNYTHYLKGKASTFATIYQYSTSQPESVIKCTVFKPKDFHDCLVNIVKEYSFLKIAGVLGIGPKANQIMGFDFVVYPDCIEFSMERCLEIKQMDENKMKKIKQKVRRLHKFHIVHADIKPQNLCLSATSKQPVFIDFGLSEVIQQIPGQSTHTFFMGSLSYCSKELSNLYYESTSGPVDLYYNDTLCLARSLAEIASQQKQNVFLQDESGQESEAEVQVYPSAAWVSNIDNNFMLLKAKSLLYRAQQTSEFFKSHRKFVMSNKQKLISFIKTLNYSNKTENFCKLLLPLDRDRPLFAFLVKNLRSNFYNQRQKEELQVLDDEDDNDTDILKKIMKYDQDMNQNYQMLSARMREIVNGLQVKSISTSKKELNIDVPIQSLLDSPHLIANLTAQEYFRKFIRLTDLRNGYGPKIKQNTVNIMLQHLKAPQRLSESKLNKLVACWHLLLMHFLSSQSQFVTEVIPALFHNLMIVEYYSEQQIIRLISQLGSISLQNHTQRYELLYLCWTALVWTKNRIPSRYVNNFCDKYCETFYFQLKKIEPYIMQPFIGAFFSLLLFEARSQTSFECIYGHFNYINHYKSYLSVQAFCDLNIALLNVLVTQPAMHRTLSSRDIYLHTHTLFQNRLKYKYVCNYYHFHMQEAALEIGQHYIIQRIANNFRLCFNDVGLFSVFKLTRNQRVVQQFREKDLLQKQIQHLAPQNLTQNARLVFQIEEALHNFKSKYSQDKYMAFKGFLQNKITYEFLMISLDVAKQREFIKDLCQSFSALTVLFRLFLRLNLQLRQSSFDEQFTNLYNKFIQDYEEKLKGKDVNSKILQCMHDVVPTYLLYRNDFRRAVEAYIDFLVYSFRGLQFSTIYYIMYRIYHLMKKSIDDKNLRMLYTQKVYSVWSKGRIWLRLYKLPGSINWIYQFTKFLMLKHRTKDVIYLHLSCISLLQDTLTPQFVVKYIRQTYQYIQQYPHGGRRMIEALKCLKKDRFYQLKQYAASCVCLCLLGRQKKYDANSRRVLKISLDKFPLITQHPKVMMSEILYRYLLIRGTEYNAIRKEYLSFECDDQFVSKLKKEKSRQKALWLRRLNRSTYSAHQAVFPVSILIKDYSKHCQQHQRFKRLLIQIRVNLGYNPNGLKK